MPFDDALICSRRAASRRACAGRNSGHCWRTCMVVANNVQTRSNGVDNQVNPWSRRAGGPCPCRYRRSQQRLPQRESRPKQTELSSLEFPFLSRPCEAHFRASLHHWSPAEANGSPAPGTWVHFKRDCVFGDTGTRRGQQNLRSPPTAWEEGGGLLDHHELRSRHHPTGDVATG